MSEKVEKFNHLTISYDPDDHGKKLLEFVKRYFKNSVKLIGEAEDDFQTVIIPDYAIHDSPINPRLEILKDTPPVEHAYVGEDSRVIGVKLELPVDMYQEENRHKLDQILALVTSDSGNYSFDRVTDFVKSGFLVREVFREGESVQFYAGGPEGTDKRYTLLPNNVFAYEAPFIDSIPQPTNEKGETLSFLFTKDKTIRIWNFLPKEIQKKITSYIKSGYVEYTNLDDDYIESEGRLCVFLEKAEKFFMKGHFELDILHVDEPIYAKGLVFDTTGKLIEIVGLDELTERVQKIMDIINKAQKENNSPKTLN